MRSHDTSSCALARIARSSMEVSFRASDIVSLVNFIFFHLLKTIIYCIINVLSIEDD